MSEQESYDQFYPNVDTVGVGDNFNARIDVFAVKETVVVVPMLEAGRVGRINIFSHISK